MNQKHWKDWEFIAGDGGSDDAPAVDLRRDEAGNFHIVWQLDNGAIQIRQVTPKEAAGFCLKTFVPEVLHSHFAIV